MKTLLLATTALVLCLGTAHAGGDDHFGGNETAAHSDYGGTTGYGNVSQRGSAWSGQEGLTLDRLSQVDSIGSGGSHVVDTYSIDGYSGRASWISRNSDGSGWISVPDETVNGGRRREFVPAPASKPRAAAPSPAPAPAPAPQPGPVEMPTIQAPPIQIAPPEPEKRVLAPEMGPPRTPTVITGKPRKDNHYTQLGEALRAIERAAVTPGSQNLTEHQKDLARAINMSVGAAMGAVAGGKVYNGPLGKIEGAMIGAFTKDVIADLRGGTPYDDVVRDLSTTSPEEFRDALERVGGMSRREREAIIDSVKDLTNENRQRERRNDADSRRRDSREGNRKGKANGQRKN